MKTIISSTICFPRFQLPSAATPQVDLAATPASRFRPRISSLSCKVSAGHASLGRNTDRPGTSGGEIDMNCIVANSLWLAGCIPEYARFHRAVRRVEEEQDAILKRIVTANSETELGRRHGFPSIRSTREYQERVPLCDYEDYQESIDQIAAGSANVLTREPVRILEPTSGSSSQSKLIPYTTSLQREFQAGIRAWIADLFLHCPDLMAGQAYWAISPAATRAHHPSGNIRVGFEDDTSYLGNRQIVWRKP